jgi:hypothetical protein
MGDEVEMSQTMRLSSDQVRCLNCLLDEVVPPSSDGRLPGAGGLELASPLAASLERAPDALELVLRGIAALDERARSRGSVGFAAIPEAKRPQLVEEVEADAPGLMATLAFCVYPLYYRAPQVLEGLGLEGRPPFPKGYELEPFDEDLVAPVRRLPRLFRAG